MRAVNTLAVDGEETLQRVVNGDAVPVREGSDVVRRVYIAGPMRGLPAFNFPMFAAAAAKLRAAGYVVLSPHEHDLEEGFDPTDMDGTEDLAEVGFNLRDALAWDLEQVTHVDGIYLLPGWERSSGVRAEMAAAVAVGNFAATGMDQPWLSAGYVADVAELDRVMATSRRSQEKSVTAMFLDGPAAGTLVALRPDTPAVLMHERERERETFRDYEGKPVLEVPVDVPVRYDVYPRSDGRTYLSTVEPVTITREQIVALDRYVDWRADDHLARIPGELLWRARVDAEKEGLTLVWPTLSITTEVLNAGVDRMGPRMRFLASIVGIPA